MSRTRRALVPLLAVAAVLLSGSPAGAAGLPETPDPVGRVDDYPRYEGQTRCAAVPSPGIVAFRQMVTTAYPTFPKGSLLRSCSSGGSSEHKDGRAWDWPMDASDPEDVAAVEEVMTWLTEADEDGNRDARMRRLGIMYVIWDERVYKAYGREPGWAPYTGASPHTDHVHFSMSWDGAWQTTSWGLRTAAATPGVEPAGSGLSVVLRSSTGAGALRSWDPSTGLSDVEGIGGTVVGGFGTAALPDGTLVVGGRGADDQLWVNRRSPKGSWEGWVPGGGLLSARPGLTADAEGRVHVAVRGADGKTWLTTFGTTGRQGEWRAAGGGVLEASGPGIAWHDGRIELVVLGTDGAPWRRTRTSDAWTHWTPLDGAATGDVGLATSSRGVVVAVRGPDERAYVRTLDDGGWIGLGGVLASAPGVAGAADRVRVSVVVRGTDGRLYRTSGGGGTWDAWTSLQP
jgi:hypothetical protein